MTSFTQIISVPLNSICIADIGAAYFGETPPYEPLLNAQLGRLFAFDADNNAVIDLRSRFSDATILPYAIADGAEHKLYVCPAGMTSLLEPDQQALAFFNLFSQWGTVQRTEKIQTKRLDDVAELPSIDFLKMDIQGGELMALQNGRKKLAQCVAVQVEVSFMTLYKSQPVFSDIDQELRRQGLVPHCFTDVKRWSIAPTVRQHDPRLPFNQLLEADIVYVRSMVKPSLISDEQLRKLAAISHLCYNSPDLTARCIIELQARGLATATAVGSYLAIIR